MKPLFFLLLLFLTILYASDVVAFVAARHHSDDGERLAHAVEPADAASFRTDGTGASLPVEQWLSTACIWLAYPLATDNALQTVVQRTWGSMTSAGNLNLVAQESLVSRR